MGAWRARWDERDSVTGHDDVVESTDDVVDEHALNLVDRQFKRVSDVTRRQSRSGRCHLRYRR